MRKLVLTLTALGCLSLVATGCAPAPTGQAHQQFLIVPGESIGQWRLGMPLAEVRSKLGQEDQRIERPEWRIYRLFFHNVGPHNQMGFGLWKDTHTVESITIFSKGSPYRTKEGIGIGSTAADLERFFGPPDRRIPIRFGAETTPSGFSAQWKSGIRVIVRNKIVIQVEVFSVR